MTTTEPEVEQAMVTENVTLVSADHGNVDRTEELRHVATHVSATSTEPVTTTEPRAMVTTPRVINPTTYSLMIDNLDTNIKPHFKRIGSDIEQSLHYVHFLAIKDRISQFNQLSTAPYHTCMNSTEKMALQLLPSIESDRELKNNIIMNVARVVVAYIPYFQFSCSDIVDWHKEHQYYKEMSTKSDVVHIVCGFLFIIIF